MSDTKNKILQTAIQLFNEKGVNNVTIRTIADELSISSGNLAYHYKNKESIIEDAFRQMGAARKDILTGVQEIPSLETIYSRLVPLVALEKKYLFLSLDVIHIARNHPDFAQLQRKHIEQTIAYIRAVIGLSQAVGNMRPEKTIGAYDRLSHGIWMLMYFWLMQKEMRENKDDDIETLRKSIWELVLPNMTDKGIHKFKKLLFSINN